MYKEKNYKKTYQKNRNFFLKLKIVIKDIIKIKGIKKSTCLNSSYKFTFRSIRIKIIEEIVNINDPTIIKFLFSKNNFFSINGNNTNPISITKGNLKNSHINKYVGGKSWAFIHSPRVIVQTVCMCPLIKIIE